MRKLTLIILCVSFCFSCSDDEDQLYKERHEKSESVIKNELLEEFGRGLSIVLEESSEARLLVKREALKKINYDYDALYLLIKDFELAKGKTLKDLLSKHINQNILDQIEVKFPTLTIFVPTLPNESFSAETWNTDIEKPYVALEDTNEGEVLFLKNLERFHLPYDEIPLLPVVVIKKNERIIVNKTKSNLINNINGTNLCFIDEGFDNIRNKGNIIKSSRRGSGYAPSIKTIEAYNKNASSNGWQRDYIYYNIVGSQDRGVFNKRCIETIVGFKMQPALDGRGWPVYNRIAESMEAGDPVYEYYKDRSGRNGYRWTRGDFEFIIRVILGSKSPTGNETTKGFFAKASDLFEFEYVTKGSGRDQVIDRTKIKDIKCKTTFFYIDKELFAWDLSIFSTQYKISVEEADSDMETTDSKTTSYEYATNFSFDITQGETTKIGTKFGASAKETIQTAFSTKVRHGSDLLGDVIIDFGEPLIDKFNANSNSYEMFRYKSGYFEVILDVKVR